MKKNKKNRHAEEFSNRRDNEENMRDKNSSNLNSTNPAEEGEAPEILDNFDAVEDGEEQPADDSQEIKVEPAVDASDDNEVERLKAELEKEKKEYLFLMAEFDNFRKRTLKEKSEIIKNAGEKVFKGLLPIVDDMERGIKASEEATDVATVREGLVLIYNKLIKFMEANGVKAYPEDEDTFDADRHEAITAVPVPDENQKGKILDTIEKGYTINDKVLRHARVVVGQ